MKPTKKTTRNTKLYSVLFVLFLMNLHTALGQADSMLLSIGLADFRGEEKGMYIELSWELSNQNEAIDFIVERAGSDGLFKSLGTASTQNFLDQHPVETVHYYRLLTFDVVGSEMYSTIIAIEHDLHKEMKIAPNPATTFVDVGFYMEESSAQVMIFDQQGNLVQQTNIENHHKCMQYFHLDLAGYHAGMYLLRVVEGTRATTMKFAVL